MIHKLLDIDPWDLRRSCDCCGAPTLGVPLDADGQPDFDFAGTSCLLCEWDNVALDLQGAPLADDDSDADRNDGVDLATARANFAQFASIYSPDAPPEWRVSEPDAAAVALRRELQAAYAELSAAGPNDIFAVWETAKDLERQLAATLSVQLDRDAELFDDEEST